MQNDSLQNQLAQNKNKQQQAISQNETHLSEIADLKTGAISAQAIATAPAIITSASQLSQIQSEAGKLLLEALSKIVFGKIEIILPTRDSIVFQGSQMGPQVQLQIKDYKTFEMIIDKSDIGLGEAYIKGYWDSPEISNLIEFAVLNKGALQRAFLGIGHKILFYKLKHFFSFNSKWGAKRNIRAHYDLGNNFYSLWLDQTMTYSSAYWAQEPSKTLAEAQLNKYALILKKLNAKPGAHILEIGCGWGGFAEFAASQGYQLTGITISKEQFDFAKERIQKKSLQNLVDFKLIDYRDVKGTFDHVVSIEMLEAVGEAYWPIYFKKIHELVKPGGTVAIQTITIADKDYSSYRKGTDFIQQYIFPGGMLPCESVLSELIKKNEKHTDISITRFGLDYARTLKEWDQVFESQRHSIEQLGYNLEFQCMWKFYLKYCEGAFRSGQTNVINLSYSVIKS